MLSHFSHGQLFETLWTVAHGLLCPWDFLGKNSGVGCPALLPGDLPKPAIKPASLMSPELAGGFFTLLALIWYSFVKV